jgi:hypothetical protein
LTHELCHAALEQAFGAPIHPRVPRWFGEGVCTVLAGQGDDRMALADVVTAGRDAEVLDDAAFAGADLQRGYGASYALMRAVDEQLGTDAFALMLARAVASASSEPFARAFTDVVGIDRDSAWRRVVDGTSLVNPR